MRLQQLAEILANRLPKSAGVPCPADRLCALGRRRHECEYPGRIARAFHVLHDVLAPVALDVQPKDDIRAVLTAFDYFDAKIVRSYRRSVRSPVFFRGRLGYLERPATD